MTSLPSNVQTAFCSPSKTRSFGATPFSRSSFNCSLTSCSGFCLVICVPCSDIELPPSIRATGSVVCHLERSEGSQRNGGQGAPSLQEVSSVTRPRVESASAINSATILFLAYIPPYCGSPSGYKKIFPASQPYSFANAASNCSA